MLISGFLSHREFVNGDQIARGLSPLSPDSIAIQSIANSERFNQDSPTVGKYTTIL
jgi:hypothetical protein